MSDFAGNGDIQWCFSQVKGTLDDDVSEAFFSRPGKGQADIISCVEFNHDGDLLATGDKGGRVVIFQRDPSVPVLKPMELMVEASPRRIFANAHTYHINSISINSDQETYLSADDLRINLWHMEVTDQSFNIVDIKPTNMEELTEVITAAEFHPHDCNVFVYSSSKGTIRLCDMRQAALCDSHSKLFEEPEDPTNRSFFSEIISSISDVKFSNSGRYMISRDYLSVKVWDLHMETKPIETYPVHEYLRPKLCSLYENDCIFDKFECCWSGNDSAIMTGSYNNFFRMFDRTSKRDVTLEASRETAKPRYLLKPRKVWLLSWVASKTMVVPNVRTSDNQKPRAVVLESPNEMSSG
ncbi:Serine/threonine-protein phosphatase 2A regulatory subunit B delta isoform [Portunus trituberculatus]|uniref:Serine/threonine-protein phosphatase 2A 55 kDa regulatory subunit B n=1 Tax=Portunus trituberculatus TaxID=210409 RepID=A0A5B7EBW8_PORTR|nr:Serine/threonine-protein phosphatase 2A regulatory subunit B delta isoform [Portunus trituberculatus]